MVYEGQSRLDWSLTPAYVVVDFWAGVNAKSVPSTRSLPALMNDH